MNSSFTQQGKHTTTTTTTTITTTMIMIPRVHTPKRGMAPPTGSGYVSNHPASSDVTTLGIGDQSRRIPSVPNDHEDDSSAWPTAANVYVCVFACMYLFIYLSHCTCSIERLNERERGREYDRRFIVFFFSFSLSCALITRICAST